MGVFKTIPVEPLQNLAGILSICYVIDKVLTAYTICLCSLPLKAKVHTVMISDLCQYWLEYVTQPINLELISYDLSLSLFHPHQTKNPDILYLSNPPDHIITRFKESLICKDRTKVHIIISPYISNNCPITFHSIYNRK